MSNSTTTLEGDVLLQTQFELVGLTTVSATIYGIAFTLFCQYVHALVPQFQDQERKKQAIFMLVYTTIIMLFGLYDLVSNTWVAQDAYIKHSNYPDGPYSYAEATLRFPSTIACVTFEALIHVLTSIIQIWRVWVVWNVIRYAGLIIVVPSLCLLAFTALYLRSLILETTLSFTDYIELDFETQIAEVSIQAATTILCTLLISLFLLYEHWRQRKLLGQAQRSSLYMKIIAMLIESYALESIWLLIVAVDTSSEWTLFNETRTNIEIVAYLLVQYRVASGKAYESRRGPDHISSLYWNRSNNATTQLHEAGKEGDGPTIKVMSHHFVSVKPEPEVSEVLPISSMA